MMEARTCSTIGVETVAWIDTDEWLTGQLDVEDGPPLHPATLLHEAAARERWTPATQLAVLLDFIDGLAASDPEIGHRFRAHLAGASAEPEAMRCRECGEPMFLAVEGTSHHAGDTMDGIDHARDRDHAAIADEEG